MNDSTLNAVNENHESYQSQKNLSEGDANEFNTPKLNKMESQGPIEFKKKFSFVNNAEILAKTEYMELFWEDLTIKAVSNVKRNIKGKNAKVFIFLKKNCIESIF